MRFQLITAIILAAGVGKRLGDQGTNEPKCLLRFGDKSLLERHLEILNYFGIKRVVLVLGYKKTLVHKQIVCLKTLSKVTTIYNPDYRRGSLLSLWCARSYLANNQDVLVMDADVLYDYRIIQRILASPHKNCLLLDRNFEAGDEPVKICIRRNKIAEFRKKANCKFDFQGESVGFFRFNHLGQERLLDSINRYLKNEKVETPYEEAIRDIVLEFPEEFGFEDCTGLPWIEIDFQEDVTTANNEILPYLAKLPTIC